MASRPVSGWEGLALRLPRIVPVDRREWRAAGLLIACVLGYGLLVFPASGASAGAVLGVFLVFGAATGKAAALVLIACLAVAAGSPRIDAT